VGKWEAVSSSPCPFLVRVSHASGAGGLYPSEECGLVGPGEGGAAAVGAMDDDDFGIGEGDTVVDGADGGVVPPADLTEVDAGEDVWGKAEVLANPGQMVYGDDGADGGRELEYLDGHLGHIGRGEGNVGGGEGDLFIVELLDSGLGADAVVGDVDVGMVFAEGLNPRLIEGGGEGGARGPDRDALGGAAHGSGWRGFVQRTATSSPADQPGPGGCHWLWWV